jgi:hypothetical protein
MSASGQYQTCCNPTSGLDGSIYISSDYGNNWTATGTSSLDWSSVAVSESGQYQVAGVSAGSIWVSNNYGSTWIEITTISNNVWRSLSISASGQYITAVPYGDYIYTCQNSIANGVVSVGNYSSEPVGTTGSIYYDTSSSALKVYNGTSWSSVGGVTASYSDIFSTQTIDLANFGQNWVQNTSVGQKSWRGISLSSTGQYQTANNITDGLRFLKQKIKPIKLINKTEINNIPKNYNSNNLDLFVDPIKEDFD